MAAGRTPHMQTYPNLMDILHDNRRAVIVLALGFALLLVSAVVASIFVDQGADTGQPAFAGMELESPRALPAFDLQRADGEAWSSDATDGRLAMFFFGYTNCPDVCPLTLSRAKQLRAGLGNDAARVDFYFVTVDPARDTPERLGLYISQFDPAIAGLTGTPEQLAAATSAFGVVAQQVPSASGTGYAVDHTATSFLIDDGAIRLLYAHDTPAGDVANDLSALLAETNGR